MPLHLLGKKSWNVYNKDAIARVKRDEEEHAAREAAREQRDQEIDAARRTAILRGETPPALPIEPSDLDDGHRRVHDHSWEHSEKRRRRRLNGEDDTARDIRLAAEDQERGAQAARRLEAPITDQSGHIQLFTGPKEDAKGKHADEGPRLADAAGYDRRAPWYVDSRERSRKDAFGREDEGRKSRDDKRLSGADPLAAMRSAQRALKIKKDEDRVITSQAPRQKRSHEHGRHYKREHKLDHDSRTQRQVVEDEHGLDGFSLDAPSKELYSNHQHRE